MSRLIFRSLLLLSTVLLVGCTAVQPPTIYTYDEFLSLVRSEEDLDLATVLVDLSDSELTIKTITELDALGRQVERVLDRPLRLGSLGSAILDRLEFSYVGHLAMYHFYEYFENDHASVHQAQLDRIVEYMTRDRDGSLDKPYRALTPADAVLFVKQSGYKVIGSIYVQTNADSMVLQLMRLRDDEPFDEVYFDFSALYSAFVQEIESQPEVQMPVQWPQVVANLASAGDTAAQLSLGRFLANSGAIPRAERMYLAASRAGNGFAHMLYGDLFVDEALRAPEQNRGRFLQVAQSHYSQAIEYGYHTALRQQGILLHRGFFGEGRRSQGLELLERAISFDDTIALRYLGEAYRFGDGVDIDFKISASLYERAAQLGDRRARIEYYRVLAHPDADLEVTDQVVDWLLDSAAHDDELAMLELGNCFIRGCAEKSNYRKAVRWYRKAARTAPENPEVINSIAWTLAVTDRKRLRDPDYALVIIEHLMENDEGSRGNPAIVDTWAAVHAALGNFERAVELQREALALAIRTRRSQDLIDVIQGHLDSFLQGEALSEAVP